MKPKSFYTAAVLLAFSAAAFAQTQSGSSIGGSSGLSNTATACDRLSGVERAKCLSDSASGGASASSGAMSAPSTGTSADRAGAAGTTAPRAPETSVGTSGAASGASATGTSSGLCDTLIGEERMKCLREQASTGTAR